MAERDAGGVGSAQRRRERRLRSMLRHERQSVAMALAEALHHSSGPSTKKVVERREGSEEMEVETHTKHRRLHLWGRAWHLCLRWRGRRRGSRRRVRVSRRSTPRPSPSSPARPCRRGWRRSGGRRRRSLEEEQQAMRVKEEDPGGWQQALGSDGVQ